MALKFADRLESNNSSAYGIVKAIEVAGHKTVSSLSALCNLPDCILSVSGSNTGNDAIGQLWYVVDEGKIYQLVDWDNRKVQEGWSEYGAENVTKEELQEALDKKQDKLIPGKGIEITEDNVISCTLDTQIFEFVDELPPLTEAKENKIYLVPKEENVGENQVYVEYIVTDIVDEAGFPTRGWEKIGEYDLGIELAPYLKITDAEATYVKKADIVNTLEGGTPEQVLGAQMGAELKKQIDELSEDTVHSVTATPEKGVIVEGTKNDPTVGILRDPESEDFLTLGEAGLGIKGVQEAINLGDDTVREEHKVDLEKMQSHTEYLYDINTLFPEQGQGDNKDQWTLTRALSKLDALLTEEERKSGIKMKFIDSNGEWVTYTFYGGDLLNEENWAYDLTSKDFTELASQIPVATPDSNGIMSAEDKKKFDELKEGIEDGRSILNEITDAVQEAKDVIDAYTVNGYKISENPVLNKADIGLDQVDNTSDMDKPVSTAQQEAHDKLQSHTEYLYNINTLFPGDGEGENSDLWGLQSAIVRLDASLTDEEKVAGIKIKFLTLDGKWRTYTFTGKGSFTSPDSWSYDLTSEDFEELATTDLPTATQETNGTMSKEDKLKLDTLSEGIEDGISIVDKINEIVGENKEIIDNYTVNGYKISENPVLNKADIGLSEVTNDAQVKRSEMGVQNGVATLDENGKVPTNQLPDAVLGNVRYMGVWDAALNEPLLENGNEEQNGYYYIVSNPGTQFGYDFDAGDWIINSAGTWSKVDNVDAVKSVNGQSGIVELKIEDIPNLRKELDQKVEITDFEQTVQEIKNSTDTLYNVTDLFPGEGQTGENNEQWDLQHAISKLDGTLGAEEKVTGIKIKFIDEEGDWVTYTFNGSDFVSPDSWSYDLTSNDIDNLAELIPEATDSTNGLMSAEDKKKFDELKEGIEDGKSILDEIDEAVQEAKGIIDEYTVNGHKISENPVLDKVDVGLDQVDNTSDLDKPVSTAQQELVDQTKETIDNYTVNGYAISTNPVLGKVDIGLDQVDNTSDLDKPISTATQEALDKIESQTDLVYNINALFPGEGQGDESNQWTLQLAASKADSYVPDENKVPGTKIKFLDENGKWRTYTYYSGAFADPSSWAYDLTSKDFEELATTNLPVATQEANGVMSKEDKKILDTLAEGFDGETSIADQITEKVEEAKTELNETIDNTKQELQENINTTKEELQASIDKTNEDLSNHIGDYNNPHQVTKEQVGLGNVTNDTQVKRIEMGIPGGVATLDENGRIPESQIQERQLQNVKYIGLWSAASNEPQLSNNTPERNGDYYVVNTAGEQLGIKFEPGDWVINNGGTWQKVDNTETVTSVNGKIGDVVIEIGDIANLQSELDSKALKTDLENSNTRIEVIENQIGQPNGIATLDEYGQLVQTQIPEEAVNVLEGVYVDGSTFNNLEGEPLEHRKGTIYVDTTSGKIYRWGENSFIELATIAGITGDLQAHIEDKNNPHQVTKEQVGLGNVTNDAQVKRDEMGIAQGVATLDENGKVPVGQLPGQVDEVFGIDHFVSTKTDISASRLVIGATYYVEDEKKIYTAISDSELDEGKMPEKGVIYSNRETNIIYRWDGADLIEVGNPVHIGETEGTAYPGEKGKETTDKLNAHLVDFENPHQVTKDQVGLGNVDNTSDLDKPVSTAQQEAIDQAKGAIDSYTVNGYRISENPVLVKGDVGLGNVDNTADLDKPISTATQTAIDKLNENLSRAINTHTEDFNNPHRVTKDQVGLANVDNTSDANKPVSTAQQAAIDKAVADLNSTISDNKVLIQNHINNKSNPHEVNKAQVGLDKVDNTSDLEKPVSLPQQEAINTVKDSVADLGTDLSAHLVDYDNPHRVTKAQVGLGKVDNTSDLEKPISTATQNALNTLNTNIELAKTEIGNYTVSGHKISENPQLTKDDVGLGNVDNTSDINKPISHLTQDALDALEAKIDSIGQTADDGLKAHLADYNNPHKVTADQLGLGNVENTSDLDKPISTATQEALDNLQEQIEEVKTESDNGLSAHLADYNNPHKVTAEQIGVGAFEGLTPEDLPISDATTEAIDNITNIINEHIANTENPHQITKEQVGLGNVTDDAQVKRDEMGQPGGVATLDETGKVPSSQLPSFVDDVLEFDSLEEFPNPGETGKIYVAKDTNLTYRWSGSRYIEISASLALGETSSTAYPGDKGKATTDSLNSHLVDFNNPHQVTKEQVGLGNVENLAPKDMPISDAQQTVINEIKQSIETGNAELSGDLESHIQNFDNPHKVTAAQLGLDKVNNTSDLDKPISTATQEALDKITETLTTTGTDLSAHLIDFDNPHRVTKDQIGLGNVNNTSDLDKPISTATQTAINALDDRIDELEKSQSADLSAHLINFNNPHKVTKDQVGLGKVDNTSDKEKPISDAQQAALDELKTKIETVEKNQATDLSAHLTDFNNPHRVTKNQVGLGNVDNTADKDKPVSDATTKAISDAKAELNTALTSHINNKENPHGVTKAQVGLDQVDNTSDANKPVSGPQQTALNSLSDRLMASLESHTTNYSNPHKVTKDQIGLGKVDNTSDLEKPVSAATEKLITETKTELQNQITSNTGNLDAHLKDFNNPHKVTKDQVGLGNVENLAPKDMPVSTAVQDALNSKADLTEEGIIEEKQLPRRTLHSMFYKGFWDANLNSPVLQNGNSNEDGDYYLVTNGGSYFGYQFMTNDIVFNANGNWYRLMGSAERDEETKFLITKFVADQYQFEKGSSATINFEWEYQMTPDGQVTFQNINQYNIPVEDRTYVLNGVTQDTTFILNSSFLNQQAQAELEVKFHDKFYVGTSGKSTVVDTDLHSMDSYFVDGVTDSLFKLYDCSGGKYIYVAIPSEVADNYIIFCNGAIVNDTIDVTRTVVNASGGSAEYKIMRFTNKYNGTLSVNVKLLSNIN